MINRAQIHFIWIVFAFRTCFQVNLIIIKRFGLETKINFYQIFQKCLKSFQNQQLECHHKIVIFSSDRLTIDNGFWKLSAFCLDKLKKYLKNTRMERRPLFHTKWITMHSQRGSRISVKTSTSSTSTLTSSTLTIVYFRQGNFISRLSAAEK